MDSENNNGNEKAETAVEKPKSKPKGLARFLKFILKLICVLLVISVAWAAFSMIGRVKASSVIPASASVRISVSNPVRLLDGILTHESLDEISSVPALAQAVPIINMLKENPVLKNRLVRFVARGNIEMALLPSGDGPGTLIAVWDMGFLSPLLRILPAVSGLISIPNLYYVQAGNNSRFEFRMEGMTLYVGPYRNLLFITGNASVFESRSSIPGSDEAFSIIKPSSYDAALMLSNDFVGSLLADQDPGIAAILSSIEFDSKVEAGLSIYPKKLEFRLAAPLSSGQSSLSRLLGQRSQAPGMAERIPADAQYATILSAGTLEELYQTALVFTPGLDDMLRTAGNASRAVLGLTLDDLLFSWTGNEFAVFGIEGRPHPVYAVQVSDDRKRQEVFDKAFKSIVLNEDVRLNLDGMRIPRIELPEFLQNLLRRWNIFIPSPYYTVYRDFFLVSESAEALLASVRAMQRNDVLPRTAMWRNIAGGRTTASAFSLYYSLDLSMPFFLRKSTALSGFLSLYRQGLVRMSFDKGVVDVSLSLVPGSGSGVILVNGYPLDVGGRPSNRVYGVGSGENSRVFFTSGNTAVSVNLSDNSTRELSGQGSHWVISADGIGGRNAVNAWVVSDRGRVTLVDGNMEPAQGFPVLTGVRLSSPPAAYEGKLYLCDEDGKVHVVDENGGQSDWETSFTAALRSPPSFLTVSTRRGGSSVYAAVYPKSFFGEIWLLSADGRTLPNWPAPISAGGESDDDSQDSEWPSSPSRFVGGSSIAFGSPILFTHNNRTLVAFVNQSGELLVYDENAARISPFPVYLDGIFYLQPVFDGDYLWLVSSNGTFFRVSLDGEVLYQRIPGFSVMEEGHITVFDSDGDKVPEVFITGEGNALYAYTRNFRSLENFPLPVWGRPFFVPAQGGRKAEIFGMGMDRRLYRWQFK
jgi:outer membrane protein assembly factor BamB